MLQGGREKGRVSEEEGNIYIYIYMYPPSGSGAKKKIGIALAKRLDCRILEFSLVHVGLV
jgi:hypothetical protein